MSLTKEQLELRRTRIGASEIGTMLDLYSPGEHRVDPHKTALDVFTEKLYPQEREREKDDHRQWGLDIEDSILRNHARKSGLTLLPAPGTLTHGSLCATPDGLGQRAIGSPIRDIQAKNSQWHQAMRWGEPGTDNAPLLYVAQVTVEIGVLTKKNSLRPDRSGADIDVTGDLVVSIGGAPPVCYPIVFDPEMFDGLGALAEKFCRDHLQTGKPPVIDGTDSTAEYLRRRYRQHSGEMKAATDEARLLAAAIKTMSATRKAAEQEEAAAKHALCEIIGEAAGIEDIATWKKTKDTISRVTDMGLVAADLAARLKLTAEDMRALREKYTREIVTREGYRRLRLIGAKEE